MMMLIAFMAAIIMGHVANAQYPPCAVCGCPDCPPGFIVGNPNAMIEIPPELASEAAGLTAFPCSLIDFLGSSGNIPVADCDSLRLLLEFRSVCGCPALPAGATAAPPVPGPTAAPVASAPVPVPALPPVPADPLPVAAPVPVPASPATAPIAATAPVAPAPVPVAVVVPTSPAAPSPMDGTVPVVPVAVPVDVPAPAVPSVATPEAPVLTNAAAPVSVPTMTTSVPIIMASPANPVVSNNATPAASIPTMPSAPVTATSPADNADAPTTPSVPAVAPRPVAAPVVAGSDPTIFSGATSNSSAHRHHNGVAGGYGSWRVCCLVFLWTCGVVVWAAY